MRCVAGGGVAVNQKVFHDSEPAFLHSPLHDSENDQRLPSAETMRIWSECRSSAGIAVRAAVVATGAPMYRASNFLSPSTSRH